MKEGYQKALKKVTFFLLSSPVLFNRYNKQKQKGPGTSSQWLSRLQNKFRKITLLVMYYISDQVWSCNIKQFLSYSKKYICKFMQASLWHHKLFHFHFHFWIWKVWKGREKITKIWKSWERKELFRWNEKHF